MYENYYPDQRALCHTSIVHWEPQCTYLTLYLRCTWRARYVLSLQWPLKSWPKKGLSHYTQISPVRWENKIKDMNRIASTFRQHWQESCHCAQCQGAPASLTYGFRSCHLPDFPCEQYGIAPTRRLSTGFQTRTSTLSATLPPKHAPPSQASLFFPVSPGNMHLDKEKQYY